MFKKIKIALLAAAVAAVSVLSGCYAGNPNNPDQNFAALKRFNKWNNSWQLADSQEANKWINAVLGFFPGFIAYGFCALGDVLIFNSMGFWTGDNPFAATIVTDENGVEYQFARNENTLTITNLSTNQVAEFGLNEDGTAFMLAAK